MKLTLGFSPCPNDTFIFDAMVHGRVDTEGLTFEYFLADVEVHFFSKVLREGCGGHRQKSNQQQEDSVH